MKSDTMLMTRGPIFSQIIRFSLPIFWGQLFQQLYNVVDSIVVGHLVGRNALAAVSSTGPLIFLLVGLFGGIFTGAGVIISRFFGAENEIGVRKAVHTAIAFSLMSGVVLTLLGIIFSPHILRLMDTPDTVLPDTINYLRIYFGGIISIALFNATSGIFQAVGDSKHPLYYLIFASVLNVILDLLLVGVFHLGVAGAAIATVIAQGFGTVLAFRRLLTVDEVYKVTVKEICFHKSIFISMLNLGIPSGIQNAFISIANVVVQANINTFGDVAMAGCGAFTKLEGFVFIPITAIAIALTTFVGQNLGAGKHRRAIKGAWFGIMISCLMAEIFGIAFYLFAPQMISLFSNEPAVVAMGALMAKRLTLFFFLLAFSHSVAGIMRGAGKAVVPMIVMFSIWCVLRVTYIEVVTSFIPEIEVVFWAYPITWTLSSIAFFIYMIKSDWVHSFDKDNIAHAN